MSHAEALFDQVDICDTAIDLFSPTQFGRLAGSCYLFLGDAKRAEPILAETACLLRDGSKAQAIVLGNLSLAYVQQGHLYEAVARLHEAMDIVEVTWGGGGFNVVSGTCRALAPWRQLPAVEGRMIACCR